MADDVPTSLDIFSAYHTVSARAKRAGMKRRSKRAPYRSMSVYGGKADITNPQRYVRQ
jgi:hypothetical protein